MLTFRHIFTLQYLTNPYYDEAEATKNLINSAVNGLDMTTGLKSTTHIGPPKWNEIFEDIHRIHGPMVEVGVFYNGPSKLGREVRKACGGRGVRAMGGGGDEGKKGSGFAWKGDDF